MTRHKLSNECMPTLERDRSAEEFFERFPEEYQQSRESIRRLYELLRKKLTDEQSEDQDELPGALVDPCPEDV